MRSQSGGGEREREKLLQVAPHLAVTEETGQSHMLPISVVLGWNPGKVWLNHSGR
jgi:hypothetical protein